MVGCFIVFAFMYVLHIYHLSDLAALCIIALGGYGPMWNINVWILQKLMCGVSSSYWWLVNRELVVIDLIQSDRARKCRMMMIKMLHVSPPWFFAPSFRAVENFGFLEFCNHFENLKLTYIFNCKRCKFHADLDHTR